MPPRPLSQMHLADSSADTCPSQATLVKETVSDIEHVPVHDDPRAWSHVRKTLTLIIVSSASLIAGLANTCQNPANAQIEQDQRVPGSYISWSVSIFILVQGLVPIVWSAISEIRGRKIVYLLSLSLFVVGSAGVATSSSIYLFIGMRAVQALGSGALTSIAAATLADIYEPHERGTKMGIYYSAPLLGNSMGPFLGGIVAQAFGWRAVFWLMLIIGGSVLALLLLFFKDTFRKERSLSYQNALRKRFNTPQLSTLVLSGTTDINPTSSDTPQQTPPEKPSSAAQSTTTLPNTLDMKDITLSFVDANPFPPIILVLRRWNNNVTLIVSGLLFAFTYTIAYTCARTLSTSYGYGALYTGLVLLSNGVGSICGSILGGRWSDRVSMKLKAQHNGTVDSEMRLQSTFPVMPWLLLSTIGYGWICRTHQPVAAICVMLFISNFCASWMYSSTLAYIVNANTGRPSTAVAANSAYRGTLAFVAAEVAIPLQDSLGDGGMYTVWTGILIVMEMLVLLVLKFGKRWRERCEEAEKRDDIDA